MNFNVSCELHYNLNSPATFLFALKCVETGDQRLLSESLATRPDVDVEDFHIVSGMNRFSRIRTHNPGGLEVLYKAEVSVSTKLVDIPSMASEGAAGLNPEAIPYLFPSRYCQSDRIRQQAHAMFGHLLGSYAIASEVSDWIHYNIAYVCGSSGEKSSAIDTMETRQGVCRDFAHLGIAFCRALSIPARYVTLYAYQLNPPDFHACFEVFIDGCWYLFDPTRLAPLNGLVRIATGRDAADAAVCTIFGDPQLTKSLVSCEFIGSEFTPVTRDRLVSQNQAIALL